MRLKSVALALEPFAQHLAMPTDCLGFLAHSAFGGFFISPPTLHFAEGALPLHLFLQDPQCRIDVVVAHENLHEQLSLRLIASCCTAEAGEPREPAPLPCPGLALLQIHGRGLSPIASLQIEAHLLPLVQIADPGALDRRDMNKHILRTVLGLNEAVTLCGVEPLHGSNSHGSSFKNKIATARRRAEGQLSTRCGRQVRRSITSLGEQPNHGKPTIEDISSLSSPCNSPAAAQFGF